MITREYTTTKKQFEVFKKDILKWMKYFGLTGWKPYFVHDELHDCYANCCYSLEGRTVTFTLNVRWRDQEPNSKTLNTVAFHETGELLLARLNSHAENRYVTRRELYEASHEIIRILEKVLLECAK